MAFISKLSNLFASVAIKQPTGVWEKIIMAFHNGIPNYAWAIIVFTLVLKIVMLPLDFFNRKISAKNTKVQALVQPEVEKLQKKYGNNKQMLNQKTMELYKKYNYNVTGSCLIMLVYMALTLFIFITLFAGLNTMAAYKVGEQYQALERTFDSVAYADSATETDYEKYLAKELEIRNSAEEAKKNEIKSNAENAKKEEIIKSHKDAGEETWNFETQASDAEKSAVTKAGTDAVEKNAKEITKAGDEAVKKQENIEQMKVAAGGKTLEEIMAQINSAVLNTYKNVKNSWLWIDNVWKSDVPWKKSATSFDEYNSLARITYSSDVTTETFNSRPSSKKAEDKAKYEQIMSAIEGENRVNGYLIIPILAVAVNVLSLLATQGKLKFKRKNKEQPEEKTKKPIGSYLMYVLIPALMGYITLSYNAVFALYIFISSLVGLATTPLINFGIKKWDEIAEKRRAKKGKDDNNLSYKR